MWHWLARDFALEGPVFADGLAWLIYSLRTGRWTPPFHLAQILDDAAYGLKKSIPFDSFLRYNARHAEPHDTATHNPHTTSHTPRRH